MIIKKFQGNTEKEAILLAKDELGKEAIVTNVKVIKPKGLARLFKKPTYEITAALDETPPKTELSWRESIKAMFKDNKDILLDDRLDAGKTSDAAASESPTETAKQLEQRISNIATLLEQQIASSKKDNAPVEKEKSVRQPIGRTSKRASRSISGWEFPVSIVVKLPRI